MRPEELRIGNYIKDYDCEPYFFKVEEIHRNTQGTIAVYYRNSSIMDVEPEPINLTEEWLIKFGFKNKSKTTNYYFELGDFIIGGLMKSFYPCLYGSSGLDPFGNELKHVHQLQNLYYCLTGQELTIK